MAGYPSLQNMPGLPGTVAECEMSGVLVGPGSGPQGVSELVRSYPACNLASKQQEMRQAAANTLTFMVHLPPNIGQLTRCSILRAAFSTLVDSLDNL